MFCNFIADFSPTLFPHPQEPCFLFASDPASLPDALLVAELGKKPASF
jgi:hypothetical protein